jgi:hypothetical protein
MFRRWALYERELTPKQRTNLMLWSADFEYVAAWVGKSWRAADPSVEMPPELCPSLHSSLGLARLERQNSGVIPCTMSRHWLGPDGG